MNETVHDQQLADQPIGKQAREMFSIARVKMITGQGAPMAFFGHMAMRLELVITEKVPTAAVGDGWNIWVNPNFWVGLQKPSHRVGVLAHEIMHIALKHHLRRGHRNPELYNIAADIVINEILIECGLELPSSAMRAEMFSLPVGETTEWYYEKLMQNAKANKMAKQGGDPGGTGGVMDSTVQGKAEQTEAEADVDSAVNASKTEAAKRGDVPGLMSSFFDTHGKPEIDYWDVLRPFLQSFSKDDYCWSRPNKRFIHQGIYLPGMHSENVGKVVVLVDGSGSCWDEAVMTRFASELSGVMDVNPMELVVVYHDIPVQKVETLLPGDPFKLTPQGGGGTSHIPAFKWVEDNASDALCVIALTDLYSEFPSRPPAMPVFWISIARDTTAPWGEVLKVKV
jgi:predicted metal-dependent peptidase